MPDTPTVVAVVAALVVGYAVGRLHPGRRLGEWAGEQDYGPHGARWWVAQVVVAVEIAWAVTVHPLRTRANVRSWRDHRRTPAPKFDSQWINRHDTPGASDA